MQRARLMPIEDGCRLIGWQDHDHAVWQGRYMEITGPRDDKTEALAGDVLKGNTIATVEEQTPGQDMTISLELQSLGNDFKVEVNRPPASWTDRDLTPLRKKLMEKFISDHDDRPRDQYITWAFTSMVKKASP